MIKISIPGEVEAYLVSLRSEKERLSAGIAKLNEDLATVDEQISAVETFSGGFTKWREENSTEAKGIHSHISIRDIARCRTQEAALEKIAELSDGLANATEAGKLIQKTKLTKAKVGSVISGVYRIMSDKKKWEWISPGTFRLLTALSEEQGDSQPEASAEVSSEASLEPWSEAPPEPSSKAPSEDAGNPAVVNPLLIDQTHTEEENVPPTELDA